MEVQILCNKCKRPFIKKVSYLKRRIRQHRFKFFCSRECADQSHAKFMSGSDNPNFGGEWHGTTMADLSSEERKERGRKISETMIERGVGAGENNPRWAGGQRELNCCVCGKSSLFRPYIYRKIAAGERSPCCSKECGTVNAQRNIKSARTSIEVKMAEALSQRSIEYIEQYHLGNKFFLDFFLPEYDIVIECDGDYWHRLPAVVKRDRSKNAYIAACGYLLFRFWESEINECVDACVDIVMAEINIRETC